MTNKQKQLNLKHLNYYFDKIDGKWGKNSIKATKKFQKDYKLTQDGDFGAKTIAKSMSVWKDIQSKIGAKVDGYVGNETISKIKDFQYNNGLKVDGYVGKKTLEKLFSKQVSWDDFPNFKRAEFKCKCNKYCNGFPVEPDFELVAILQDIRNHYGKPINITSGIRCKQHNKNVGGSKTSKHLQGKAVDCYIKGVNHWDFDKYLKTRKDIRYAYTNNQGMRGANHIDIK